MRLDDLDRLARRNHGLVSREMTNLSESAWGRAIRAGTLVPVHAKVARLVGTADTPEQRILAATLAAGPGVLASHRSSAHLWGVARPASDPVDIIIPDRRPVRRLEGVVIRRPSDDAHLSPPQRRSGIACTNILRTLCDLGAVDEFGVVDAVGHALAARYVSLSALEAALVVHARPGRHGVRALRHAIGASSIDGRPIDSLLELAMRRLVMNFGLPPVEFHVVIEGWEVDFRVVGTPVLIECDGWTAHGLDRDQFERDRRRDIELSAAGWIVLRCSYRAITTDAARTAARVRAAIARWTADFDP
jgi:very-short-patch-repair endonuclease